MLVQHPSYDIIQFLDFPLYSSFHRIEGIMSLLLTWHTVCYMLGCSGGQLRSNTFFLILWSISLLIHLTHLLSTQYFLGTALTSFGLRC